MCIDLHCHTSISDGNLEPKELVRIASEYGTKMLAITDHDHMGGLKEAKEEAQKYSKFVFINGVEISVTWNDATIHVVGLDFDENNEELERKLVINRSGRIERLKRITQLFEDYTPIRGVYEGALKYAHNPEMVGRAHIAEYLLEIKACYRKQEAFDRWIGQGCCCFVDDKWMCLEECIELIHNAGGIAVVAHPARYPIDDEQKIKFIEEFKSLGGEGIEVACSSHSVDDVNFYAQVASKYDLYASVGSDFHRFHRKGPILGQTPKLPETCQGVWQLFDEYESKIKSLVEPAF